MQQDNRNKRKMKMYRKCFKEICGKQASTGKSIRKINEACLNQKSNG